MLRCEEGIELSLDCRDEDRCHEEQGGFCGSCGDGVVQLSLNEQCDDANTDDLDDCTTLCTIPRCGDGIQHNNEECDDGNNEPFDGCNPQCRPAVCGDLNFESPEECEDGCQQGLPGVCEPGIDDGDGCEFDCTISPCFDNDPLTGDNCPNFNCGNGVIEAGEECDDQNLNNFDGCSPTCRLPVCGDGILERPAGEQCDDGNNQNGDNCSSLCQLPSCGDGAINALEQCDDGNNSNGDACDNNCTFPSCGNGEAAPNELCLLGSTLDLQTRLALNVVLQDINGDGNLDLLNTNLDDLYVSLRLGDGGGFFSPPQLIGMNLPAMRSLFIADFDGDGLQDLAVGGEQDGLFISLRLGLPNVSFAPPLAEEHFGQVSFNLTGGAAGDIDGDGDDDAVCPGGIFLGGAAPLESTAPLSLNGAPVLLDVEQDGDLDILVGAFDGLQVLLNNGVGVFSFPIQLSAQPFGRLEIADLNQDTFSDVLSANSSGLIAMLGNGDGTFQAPVVSLVEGGTGAADTGDINGDGVLDAALVAESGVLLVYVGNGDGSFQAPASFLIDGLPQDVAVGDLDGDGFAEVVTADADFGTMTLFRKGF